MKIYKKITLLLITVTGLFFFLFLLYQHIRRHEFEAYLNSKIITDREVINKVMEFKSAGLQKTASGYSAWDDILKYIKNPDPHWAEENLGTSLVTFKLEQIGVYDLQGNAVFSISDKRSGPADFTPDQIHAWFTGKRTVHSFIQSKGRIFEIFGAIIVPTKDVQHLSPPQGFLTLVNTWDEQFVKELEEATGFHIGLTPDELQIHHDTSDIMEVIYIPLMDAEGKKIATLKFYRENILAKQLEGVKYWPYLGILFFIIIVGLFVFLIRIWITVPLGNIAKSLTVNSIDPLKHLMTRADEFGEISRILEKFQQQKDDLIKEVKIRTQATEKFHALLIAQPDLKFIIDRSGVFHEFYTSDEKLLYKPAGEFLEKNVMEIFSPQLGTMILGAVEKLKSREDIEIFEYEMQLFDEVHFFEARLVGIYDNLVLVVARDFTDRKIAEMELIAAKERAEESDRLKTAFLANMSHEIRTPMNQILGFTQILEDENLSAAEREQFRNIIKSSGGQLLNIINDILDVSKLQSNQVEIHTRTFNLNHLLDELLAASEISRVRMGSSQVLLMADKPVDDRYAMVQTDDLRLRQVLNNLIGNALKFTTNGYIKFGYQVNPGEILFFVEDTGKGIPKEKHAWIFDRFRQEEETYTRQFGGAGLGLSICKGLVGLLGGKIWLTSAEGKGSTFWFSLPVELVELPVVQEVPKKAETITNNLGSKTILIAEDVPENIDLMRWMLKGTDVNILVAEDGTKAVETCRNRDNIDLVLMDIQMPELNGFDATREIRSFNKKIRIVAMTAFVSSEDKQKCLDAGCNDVMFKPVSKVKLLELLGRYLQT